MTLSGRILGIDYGTRRIGLALSDENGRLAFPKEILSNDTKVFSKLDEVLKKENIIEVVIGESLDFSGMPNKVSKEIDAFIAKLEDIYKFPIHREPEFLTSLAARESTQTKSSLHTSQSHTRSKKRSPGFVDASAAALILQRYLDRRNLKT